MKPAHIRRRPRQRRAWQTVEAVLDAVTQVLKRGGVDAVTTNRIAARAGVSIGSVYQYFPDKRAIFVALRERHVEQMGRLVESKLVASADATLEGLMRGLLEAMIAAHALDPELHDLLLMQAPQGADEDQDFERRLRGALRLALTSRAHELPPAFDLERALFVLTNVVEALAHGVVLRRPATLSLRAATDEAVRAVMGYLCAGATARVSGSRPKRARAPRDRVRDGRRRGRTPAGQSSRKSGA
ncbi:MAG TPA: TetR/AcrR family transcriptional regulator [Polyangia bacterium]|jgi:AcrR family transcriptional regulator|nr:TetR/AcrR family transcriptional regulator [Polyangia bacterium]